ncbi:MAG: hypothetical protein ACRCWQ_04055 [Bacilli bacterium]
MSNGKSLKELMAQKLAQKNGGGSDKGGKHNPVREVGKLSNQLPKKPSQVGRKMGI